jgi:hypothetical protein
LSQRCSSRFGWAEPTYNHYVTAIDALGMNIALGVLGGIFALLTCATRRHNRMYPKGRDRISGDPEAAQTTRRFETMWSFFSGRGGGF